MAWHFARAIREDPTRRGLLVMNHEYVDDGLLHPDGLKTWSAGKMAKSQAAHGISVLEIAWFLSMHRLVLAGYPLARHFPALSPQSWRSAFMCAPVVPNCG